MNCQLCSRAMLQVPDKTHFTCHVCLTFAFPFSIDAGPEPIVPAGKGVEFGCPRCDESLEVEALFERTNVCFCSSCRKFVVDNASVGDFIRDLRASYTGPEDNPVPMNAAQLKVRCTCPACGDQTEAHPYYGPGNCVLDTCRHCKLVWFDHGELDVIVRAPGLRQIRR